MRAHLIDGTYELFRHYYGSIGRGRDASSDVGATRGVLRDVVSMLASGVTHLGVATDHTIESFRNDMWPGYKTSAGVPEQLLAQFPLLEVALSALGVRVWAMVDLEADDALASAASVAADDSSVEQVFICTPDKDLAQSVVDRRVVQLDRRSGEVRDEEGVRTKFGVAPESIPDWLALVGDAADGFPGLKGWGKASASAVLAHYRHLEVIPEDPANWEASVKRSLRGSERLAASLSADRELAMLFRDLATLRIDRSLLREVGELEWRGPSGGFDEVCSSLKDPGLAGRVELLAAKR